MTLPAAKFRQVSNAGNRTWLELHVHQDAQYTVRQSLVLGFAALDVGIAH